MQLFRMTCATDWKARPNTTLVKIAESDDRGELLAKMDADVLEWQAEDIQNDLDGDEGPPSIPVTSWAHEERWEMKRNPDEDLRSFVWVMDGDRVVMVYHIVD